MIPIAYKAIYGRVECRAFDTKKRCEFMILETGIIDFLIALIESNHFTKGVRRLHKATLSVI